jgi:hypothetical protein
LQAEVVAEIMAVETLVAVVVLVVCALLLLLLVAVEV